MSKFLIPALVVFVTSCHPYPQGSLGEDGGIELSGCYIFDTGKSERELVLDFLKTLKVKYSGKLKEIPQTIYFKSDVPEFYLDYFDRRSKYGNKIETYWEDPGAESLEKDVAEFVESNFPNFKHCPESYQSTTSRYDFEGNR